ncbi:MAG: hypothetical protein ABEJ60_04790 [Halodesulfurarchaeum sp.]
MPLRELLAVVLGGLLGVVLIIAPRAALQLSVFLGPTRRKRGEYGSDGPVPDWGLWVVRAAGLACLGVAGLIAYQTFG